MGSICIAGRNMQNLQPKNQRVFQSLFRCLKEYIFAQQFRFRAMVFTISSMTMGLDKCPFIPASKDI